ncbi:MAG: dihydroorotate dehydrogenase-like protein [Planctomycetota bacterium]
MRLTTKYCGLELPHPLVVGASPLSDDIDYVRRLEDQGAAAVVMHSLFQEQIERESLSTFHALEAHSDAFGEALSFFPDPQEFVLGPEEHLEALRRLRQAVSIPVIASLNGTSLGGWLDHGRLLVEAGADALELNVYDLPTDLERSGPAVEQETLDVVAELRRSVTVPIAVKLSPFWSSFANMARRLVEAGADGLVLFNRFYQADIDVEALEYQRKLRLSSSHELLLRLRWIAILYGRVEASLILTGGVHTAVDLVKALMCGADGVQVVSCILQKGPERIGDLLDGLEAWMDEHEYADLGELRGSMSLLRCPDPHALERANYARILQSWNEGD